MKKVLAVVAMCCTIASLIALCLGIVVLRAQNADLRKLISRVADEAARRDDCLDTRITVLTSDLDGVAHGLGRVVAENGNGTRRALRGISSKISNSISSVQGSISDMGGRIVAALPTPSEPEEVRAADDTAAFGRAADQTTLQEARNLYAQGRFSEAVQFLANVANGHAPSLDVRLYYAASLFHARPDDVSSQARIEKDLQAIILEDPQNFVALETLGSLAVERGDWKQGLEWLSGALAQQPRDVDVLQKAGACAFAVKDFPRARELLDRAAALSPGDAYLYFSAAQACGAAGDPSGALERLDACLSLQPRHLGALLLAGSCLSDLGRHSEAAKRFSAYLAIRPDFVPAARLGDALYAQGRRVAAEAEWMRALGLSSGGAEARRKSLEVHGKLVRSAWERRDPAQCKAYASEGLAAGPSPLLSAYLGMSLRALGDEAQGTRLLKQVKESSTDTEAAALAATALGDSGQ